MKIILIKDIHNLGKGGDVLTVADGYARNYLIPQKFAILATPFNLKKVKKIADEAEVVRVEKENKFKAVCVKLKGIELQFIRKADENGHLFGSVSENDIAASLAEKGIEISKSNVKIEEHIKQLGEVEVMISFTKELQETIKIIVAENAKSEEVVEEEVNED